MARPADKLQMRKSLGSKGVQLNFYVYEHWRPDLDLCFYVGKGKGRRADNVRSRNPIYGDVTASLARLGMCVEVRMVRSGLSESEAFDVERGRIKFWKAAGVELTNRTDGGDGRSGFIRPLGIRLSQAAKEKVSAARKGIKFSAEHRSKLAQQKIGKPRKAFTAETITKMRLASIAREEEKRRRFGKNVRRDSSIKESV